MLTNMSDPQGDHRRIYQVIAVVGVVALTLAPMLAMDLMWPKLIVRDGEGLLDSPFGRLLVAINSVVIAPAGIIYLPFIAFNPHRINADEWTWVAAALYAVITWLLVGWAVRRRKKRTRE